MGKLYKGSTIKIECTIGEDITNWKIRATIIDITGASVQIATANSGGSDDQIEKTSIGETESKFMLKIPSGKTNNFSDKCILEIEIDTGDEVNEEDEIYTIYQDYIELIDKKIDWTTPTA